MRVVICGHAGVRRADAARSDGLAAPARRRVDSARPSAGPRAAAESFAREGGGRRLGAGGAAGGAAIARGAAQQLAAWKPDVLVVVAYGLILPKAVLEIPRLGCVNVHASLLPRWRGAAPVERALLAGDETTGVTIMLMDAGLDTGPILLQRAVAIEPHDTGASLRARLAARGRPAAARGAAGACRRQPVAPRRSRPRASPMPASWKSARPHRLEPAGGRDRAPGPGAATLAGGGDRAGRPADGPAERLLVYAARVASAGSAAATAASQAASSRPTAAMQQGYIRVQCGDGALDLLTLQRPGGQRCRPRCSPADHGRSSRRWCWAEWVERRCRESGRAGSGGGGARGRRSRPRTVGRRGVGGLRGRPAALRRPSHRARHHALVSASSTCRGGAAQLADRRWLAKSTRSWSPPLTRSSIRATLRRSS